MGEQKVLLPIGERSSVQRVVDAALSSKAVETIVVLGHEADAVREALGKRQVTVVVNTNHAQGMSTSLQTGVRAVGRNRDAAIFLLADQPFVTSALIDLLIDRFVRTGRKIVRPVVAGRPANPVLMSAALFPEILKQRGDVGGREIAQRHPDEQCLVSVDDARTCLDIDTADDYDLALRAVQ
jgi:molybdenum cofactor cytidylyltransferase